MKFQPATPTTDRPRTAVSNSTQSSSDTTSQDNRAPTIAVIVPVRNEEKFIARTIEALLQQEYPSVCYEVLVVDGRSTDRTREIVAQYASRQVSVRLFDNPQHLSSAARNIGIHESQGELVLVVDGHCEIDDRRYLRNLADAFVRSGADCIGRPQPLDVTGATTLQRAIAAARSSRLGHHPDSHIYSATEGYVPAHSVAVAYRREVFDRVGVFDERFDACEDVELNHRIDHAGLQCFFTPAIAIRYSPRATIAGLVHQLIRYGRGRVRLLRKHPETLSFGSLLPALFVLGCFLGPFVIWLVPALAPIYFGSLILYGTIVLVFSIAITVRQRNAALFPWLLIVFPAVHLSSGIGVLLEAIRPKQSRMRRAT